MRIITAHRAQSYQCNTRRVAASGVRTEAPKGVKRPELEERTKGESKPVREAVGSRRGD